MNKQFKNTSIRSMYKKQDTGFNIFKRRIQEELLLGGYESLIDDDDLLPFYRSGESENYILSAFGVPLGG